MTIKTIIELHARPGKRAELATAMDRVIETMHDEPGFLSATRYEVLDDPDGLVEIAEWESPDARQAWLERITTSGGLGPLMQTLWAPFNATNIRRID